MVELKDGGVALQAGASTGVSNAAGMTPLQVAASGGHGGCVSLLLQLASPHERLVQVGFVTLVSF